MQCSGNLSIKKKCKSIQNLCFLSFFLSFLSQILDSVYLLYTLVGLLHILLLTTSYNRWKHIFITAPIVYYRNLLWISEDIWLLFRVLAWEDGFCDILKQRDVTGSPIEDLYFDNSNNIQSSNLMSSLCNGTPSHYLVRLAVSEMSNASHVVGKG